MAASVNSSCPIAQEHIFAAVLQYDSPVLLYDTRAIQRELKLLESHLGEVAADRLQYGIRYSVKANSNAGLLQWLAAQGVGAEVSSREEYNAAAQAGFQKIAATSPGFDAKMVRTLVESGVEFNADNLKQLAAVPEGAPIGLRICIPVQPNSTLRLDSSSRFGIEIDDLIAREQFSSRIGQIVRLLGHVRDVATAGQLRELAVRLVAGMRAFPHVHTIDFGGGMTRLYADDAAARQAWLECRPILQELPQGTQILVEPGAQVLTRHGYLGTKVVSANIRKNGRQLVVVESSKWNLVSWSKYELVHPAPHAGEIPTDIVGPTCYENDIWMAHVPLPALREGERVIFRGTGAYVTSMARQMHGLPVPKEVVL